MESLPAGLKMEILAQKNFLKIISEKVNGQLGMLMDKKVQNASIKMVNLMVINIIGIKVENCTDNYFMLINALYN